MLTINDRQLIKESVHKILFESPDTKFEHLVDTITDSIWELLPYELQEKHDELRVAVKDECDKHWSVAQGELVEEHRNHLFNSRALVSEFFNSRGVK